MGTELIILLPPFCDHYSRFTQCIEEFSRQTFTAKLVVKTLYKSILPGTTRFNIERSNHFLGKPLLQGLRYKLGPIVTTNMIWSTVTRDEFTHHFQNLS